MPRPASVSLSDSVGSVANGAALPAVMWFQLLQKLAADGQGMTLSKVRCPEAVAEGLLGGVSGPVLIPPSFRFVHSSDNALPMEAKRNFFHAVEGI